MHRSSESVGAIAAALAKAQLDIINPEKSLVGVIPPSGPRELGRAFRYAPLSSGLCSNSKVCAELVVTDTFRHCFLVAHAASRRDDAGRRWRRLNWGA